MIVSSQKVRLDDCEIMQEWDDFVKNHPDGTPFHLSSWLRVLAETYSFEPELVAFRSNGGRLVGVFPGFVLSSFLGKKRLVSLPFSDYGGPLFLYEDDEKTFWEAFFPAIKAPFRTIEIRTMMSTTGERFDTLLYNRYYLNLKLNIEEIKKKFERRTIAYSIRKAIRKGVKVIEDNTEQGILELYRLNLLTRRKRGVPPQPKNFFLNIHRNIIHEGKGFVLLAEFKGKVVAAALFLRCGTQLHYKFNASDPAYLSQVTPNHLLMYTAIERAKAEGYEILDFGRTARDNPGLNRYKRMWGSVCVPLSYHYFPQKKGAVTHEQDSFLYSLATNLWRKLPGSVANQLGSKLYRYFG